MAQAAKKISKENKEKARVLLPLARLSYPHLMKPSAMPGTTNAPKYSGTFLLDKELDLKVVKRAMKQAKINYFGAEENWPKKIKSPIQDGDHEDNEDKEGYAGHWILKASSNEDQKPVVVDKHGKEIIESSKIYAGCYVQAFVYAYVWEFPKGSGKFGIGFILDGVQKVKDGEPFSSRKTASEMFGITADEDEDESNEADDEEE